MTFNSERRDQQQVDSQNIEPAEVEALLPWYEAGTLSRRERQRVEDALRSDPDLARHADLVREELAETICLNESLGAPSPRAMTRLMAAIDADTLATHQRISVQALAARFASFFTSFSPRTLAFAASAATLLLAVQAFLLVDMATKPQGSFQTLAQSEAPNKNGAFALVRFAGQASAGEITKFLESYQASLVDGPKPGGLYRVRVAMTNLAKEELSRIIGRMKQEQVVEFAAPSE